MNPCFLNYKNLHPNQKAILFATGPTYNSIDANQLPANCIRIGVNNCNKRDIEFDYYFFGDKLDKNGLSIAPYLFDLEKTTIKIQSFAYCNVWNGNSLIPNTGRWLTEKEVMDFGAKPYSITRELVFHTDIVQYPLANCSIVFSALQFAIFCGIKTIYLVGCDCTSTPYHNVEELLYMWNLVKETFKDIQFLSIQPVGLKELFPEHALRWNNN